MWCDASSYWFWLLIGGYTWTDYSNTKPEVNASYALYRGRRYRGKNLNFFNCNFFCNVNNVKPGESKDEAASKVLQFGFEIKLVYQDNYLLKYLFISLHFVSSFHGSPPFSRAGRDNTTLNDFFLIYTSSTVNWGMNQWNHLLHLLAGMKKSQTVGQSCHDCLSLQHGCVL